MEIEKGRERRRDSLGFESFLVFPIARGELECHCSPFLNVAVGRGDGIIYVGYVWIYNILNCKSTSQNHEKAFDLNNGSPSPDASPIDGMS